MCVKGNKSRSINVPAKRVNTNLRHFNTRNYEKLKLPMSKNNLISLKIIKDSETAIKNIINAIPDLVLKIRSNGNISYCNNNKKNLNLTCEEIIGKNIGEIFHPLTHLQFLEAIENVQKNGLSQTFEFQQFELSELHDYESRIDICKESDEFIAIIRDISEQKRLELELKKNEKKFRILLESAAQGIVVANIHGRITLINTVCEKMFGYNRDELLDQPMEILLPEPLRQRHQKHRAEFFSKPESRVMGNGLELVGLRKDGTTFPIEVGLSSIDIYEGTFVMASINDITQRKELEKKLRQIDKLEAIGQLAGGIAHDFNNVLANIIGMGELALRKMERSESPEEFIRMIIDKAYDAANLVRQLLTFSRKQSISLRPINFQSVLEHNIKLLHRYLGEEVEIKTHIEPNLYPIEADESAVGQIVTNLCINARDAMPDGGEIQLTAENIQLDTTLLSDMGEIPNGEYVKLTVIDHGVGMTRDIKKRIFDPFYTTKDIGEGTGLGLSIVYALVKQLNGWMNCKSRLGVGTTFEIFFPGLDPEAQTEQTKKSKINAKGNETILLVENEADLITSYKSSLETYGYKVLVASNGLQALNIFEQKASSIDLIVSDVVMPKMGGVELRIHAKRVNPDIKFLFISAYPDKLEPGNYILQKPFRSKELISKVREIIDK